MASQVRPGRTKPVLNQGPFESNDLMGCRPADSVRASSVKAAHTGRMYDCNLSVISNTQGVALQMGASMYVQWQALWDGYNAFYGRSGATALPAEVTSVTWQRFFDEHEPMHASRSRRPATCRICLPTSMRGAKESVARSSRRSTSGPGQQDRRACTGKLTKRIGRRCNSMTTWRSAQDFLSTGSSCELRTAPAAGWRSTPC